MSIRKISELSDDQGDNLHRLCQQKWWTQGREREDIEPLTAESDGIVSFCNSGTDNLVAFSQLLTESIYRACIPDVILPSGHQSEGLGRELMDGIIAHPVLSQGKHWELTCLEEMAPLYEKRGISDGSENLRLTRRE